MSRTGWKLWRDHYQDDVDDVEIEEIEGDQGLKYDNFETNILLMFNI
jgi:hypothetical protein